MEAPNFPSAPTRNEVCGLVALADSMKELALAKACFSPIAMLAQTSVEGEASRLAANPIMSKYVHNF